MRNVETVDYQFGEKIYTLTELTIGDMAAFRDYLKQKKMDTVRSTFEGLPEKTAELLKVAYSPITDLDVQSALPELSSIIFLVSRSLVRKHPEMTVEKTGELIPLFSVNELRGVLNAIMGRGVVEGNASTPQSATIN
jgi:hypothetical protein